MQVLNIAVNDSTVNAVTTAALKTVYYYNNVMVRCTFPSSTRCSIFEAAQLVLVVFILFEQMTSVTSTE